MEGVRKQVKTGQGTLVPEMRSKFHSKLLDGSHPAKAHPAASDVYPLLG